MEIPFCTYCKYPLYECVCSKEFIDLDDNFIAKDVQTFEEDIHERIEISS